MLKLVMAPFIGVIAAAHIGMAHPAHNDEAGSAAGHHAAAELRREIEFVESRREGGRLGEPEALVRLGRLYMRLARATGESKAMEHAISLYRDASDRGAGPEASLGLAKALYAQHRFAEAETLARDVANRTRGKTRSDALSIMAEVHLATGRTAEGRALFESIALHEPTPERLALLSIAQHLDGDDRALRTMRVALERAESVGTDGVFRAWCETMLGDFLLARGELLDAETHYVHALQLDDTTHASLYGIAEVHVREGELAGAIGFL